MINGTIIGEIKIDIIIPLNGMWGRLNPRAAKVPKDVAIIVEVIPMNKLLTVPTIHLLLQGVVKFGSVQIPIMYVYHLRDQASGSGGHDSMPSVKSIKGETLKEIGMIAMRGAIKKKNTIPQKDKYA